MQNCKNLSPSAQLPWIWGISLPATGGFRARKNCERVSNNCVLKSVILVISVGNYRNKCHTTVQKTMDKCRKTLFEIFKIHLLMNTRIIGLLNKDLRPGIWDSIICLKIHIFGHNIAICSIIICQLFVYDISVIITYKICVKCCYNNEMNHFPLCTCFGWITRMLRVDHEELNTSCGWITRT